jgi:quinol monooxygenase YgiN
MKLVVAQAQVRAEMHARFAEAGAACVRETRKEPGCLSYDLFESQTAPGAFVTVERWEDEAAIERHFTMPHTAAFLSVAAECVSAPPLIEEFTIAEIRAR